jgi:hypothetical protein
MFRLIVVVFFLSLIIGTYVTGNVVANWAACLVALALLVGARRRTGTAHPLQYRPTRNPLHRRPCPEPLTLFGRHAEAQPELALIASLVSIAPPDDLAYDILDTAFVLRWNELVADGSGPQELPPLRGRRRTEEHVAGE